MRTGIYGKQKAQKKKERERGKGKKIKNNQKPSNTSICKDKED